MNHLLMYVLEATRGGPTRKKIVELLLKKPRNMNQLAEAMEMDYKTIQHHIKVLDENNIVKAINKGEYGAMYFLEESVKELVENWD